MFDPSFSINWLAVAVACVALQALGAFWFMVLMPKPYALALGRPDLVGQKPKPIFIIGPFVCSLVLTLTNAVLMRTFSIASVPAALLYGVLTGIGYLTSTTVNVAINPNMPRPLLYGAINGPFFILSNVICCAVLAWMN